MLSGRCQQQLLYKIKENLFISRCGAVYFLNTLKELTLYLCAITSPTKSEFFFIEVCVNYLATLQSNVWETSQLRFSVFPGSQRNLSIMCIHCHLLVISYNYHYVKEFIELCNEVTHQPGPRVRMRFAGFNLIIHENT